MSRFDEPPITDPADPRLEGWYHTMELAPGIVTKGIYDLRPSLPSTGLPEDLSGMTALDVGTANGFYAFEMARRGATVTAIDAPSSSEWDWLPHLRRHIDPDPVDDHERRFELARRMLGVEAQHRRISVYDLSPQTVGTFDIVYCGSLLFHLQNPLAALAAMRSVTRGMIIAEVSVMPDVEAVLPGRALVQFGAGGPETEPGEACTYWTFTTQSLVRMLEYAGFTDCEPMPEYMLAPYPLRVRTVRARPRDIAGAVGLQLTPDEFIKRFPPPPVSSAQAFAPATPLEGDPVLAPLLVAAQDEIQLSAQMQRTVTGHASEMHEALDAYRTHLTEVEAYVRHLERELQAKEGYIATLEDAVRSAGDHSG